MTWREEHVRMDGQWKGVSDRDREVHGSLRKAERRETGRRDSEAHPNVNLPSSPEYFEMRKVNSSLQDS